MIRSLLRKFGIQVVRDRGARTTMGQALRHLSSRGFTPATVIDVGVADGTPPLYTCFPEARTLLVEPLAEFRPQLERLARRHGCEIVAAAAGPREGEAELYIKPRTSTSSAYLGRIAGEKRRVPMVALDRLVEQRSLAPPFLVKVDAEGAELEVLRGAERLLPGIDVLILEMTFITELRGAVEFVDVVRYLDERGFVLYDIFNQRVRRPGGELIQADITFVPRDSALRTPAATKDLDTASRS